MGPTRDRVRKIEQCAQMCTGHKDPAKMTHTKVALVERGLGACQASALSHSAWTMMAMVHSLLAGLWDARMLMRVMRSGAPQHAAMKHIRLEQRCRSSSRMVERPPRPPPSNRMVAERAAHQACVTVHQAPCAAIHPSGFVWESKDPCKMTYSRLAPSERGLLAKMTNAKSE